MPRSNEQDSPLVSSIDKQAIASPFSYSEDEIRAELMKSFGTEEPDGEQLNRRHVEKFLSYSRQVSLLAEEQAKIYQIPTTADQKSHATDSINDQAVEIENPYLILRENGFDRKRSKHQEQQTIESTETRSERYVRQAAQSVGRQM